MMGIIEFTLVLIFVHLTVLFVSSSPDLNMRLKDIQASFYNLAVLSFLYFLGSRWINRTTKPVGGRGQLT